MRNLISLSAIILMACIQAFAQEPIEELTKRLSQAIPYEFSASLSFYNKQGDSLTDNTLWISVDTQSTTVFRADDSCYLRLWRDSICIVDKKNGSIITGSKHSEHPDFPGLGLYESIHYRYVSDMHLYAPFYMPLPAGKVMFLAPLTTTHTAGQLVLTGRVLTGYRVNRETNGLDSLINIVTYTLDNRTGLVTGIEVQGADNMVTKYHFKDFSFNTPSRLPHLSDPDNPQYASYARYDLSKKMPLSMIGRSAGNTVMNDDILDFPLVGMGGDTTYLRNDTGWVMLDFWIFHCKPCVQFMADTALRRQIRRVGINLYCIYHHGGVTPSLQQYAAKYHAEGDVYSAREFNLLDLYGFPTYYLFSPRRELVYSGSNPREALEKMKQYNISTHTHQP